MNVHRICDLTAVHLYMCIFNLGSRAVNMLRARRYLNPALALATLSHSSQSLVTVVV